MTVTLVLAEFGDTRQGAGDAELPVSRLEPALSSFRRYMPDCKVVLYTNGNFSCDGVDEVRHPSPPRQFSGDRYGWRCNDYYKAFGILEAETECAIALDADMLVVSPSIDTAPRFADAFGLCLAANARGLVAIDARSKCDGGQVNDATHGLGYAYAGAVMIANPKSHQSQFILSQYVYEMEQRPVRGPLAMWRAVWAARTAPYLLPLQWCVTSGHQGIESPVLVHMGHADVAEYYRDRMP